MSNEEKISAQIDRDIYEQSTRTARTQTTLPATEQDWLQMRTQDVTSTEAAALFGMSPYRTLFELWHQKKSGQVPSFDENTRMKWGTRLQDTIARGIAEDNEWTVRRINTYSRDPALRMGSSFDFEIIDHPDGPGLLEIKNVDGLQFRSGWFVDGPLIEAPTHIELQLQHQMDLKNREWGCIGALIGGNEVKLLHRKRDRSIGDAIRYHVAKFWASIEANEPPPPVFPEDAEMVLKLHQHAEPGKVVDLGADDEIIQLAALYTDAIAREKVAKEDKETARAKIILKADDAERILVGKYSISAGLIGPAEIAAYTRAGYRNFRINVKKEKS